MVCKTDSITMQAQGLWGAVLVFIPYSWISIIHLWVSIIHLWISQNHLWILGRVAQSVTCLATDACLTAIPGVASSIPARSHTFVEIDHEIISTVILLPSADSFKKGCCQLQAKVCARITGYPLVQACPGKSVVRWTDRPAMTIAVDLGRKASKPNLWISIIHLWISINNYGYP